MKLKENLRMLLERIKLSNFDYLTMKEKSKRFDDMLAAISLETNAEYIPVEHPKGCVIAKVLKSKSLTISVNIPDLMKGVGIVYDRTLSNIKVIE